MEKIINYHRCECLMPNKDDDYACLKRYIHIYDIFKNESYHIGMCNEWFRLEYTHRKLNDAGTIRYHSGFSTTSKIHLDILRDVISSVTSYDGNLIDSYFFDEDTLFPTYITVPICTRPYILYKLDIEMALDVLSKRNRFDLSYKHYELLAERLQVALIRSIDKALKYAKYKKYHNQARRLKKMIASGALTRSNSKWVIDQETVISEMTDFMTQIINQYCRNK